MIFPVGHVSVLQLRFLVANDKPDWPVVQVLANGREAFAGLVAKLAPGDELGAEVAERGHPHLPVPAAGEMARPVPSVGQPRGQNRLAQASAGLYDHVPAIMARCSLF
jgi:hypothetical protein